MKKITGTIGKVFTAVALAAVLAGAAFALPLRNEAGKNFKKADTQIFEKFETVSLNNLKKGESDVSETNRANFLLGHYIVRTDYDAYFAELDETDYEAVVEDICTLLEFFGDRAEGVQLKKLLTAIKEGTADKKQVVETMAAIEKSYRAELPVEEKWFFDYGEWTTCLLGDAFLNDDEYIVEDLNALREMAKNAPQGDAQKVIKPVGALSRFIEKTSYSEEDYEAMKNGVCNVFDLILGKK